MPAPGWTILFLGIASTLIRPETAGEVWLVCGPASLAAGPLTRWYANRLARKLEAERAEIEQLKRLNDDLEARLRDIR